VSVIGAARWTEATCAACGDAFAYDGPHREFCLSCIHLLDAPLSSHPPTCGCIECQFPEELGDSREGSMYGAPRDF
jgi:hypothetical protein